MRVKKAHGSKGINNWADVYKRQEIYQILMPTHSSETVPVTSAKRSGVKLNKKTRQKYFPEDFDDDKIEQIITELLESWAVQNNPGYEKESAI